MIGFQQLSLTVTTAIRINENNITIAVGGAPAFRVFLSKISKSPMFLSMTSALSQAGSRVAGIQHNKAATSVSANAGCTGGRGIRLQDDGLRQNRVTIGPTGPEIDSARVQREERRRRGEVLDDEISMSEWKDIEEGHGGGHASDVTLTG